MLGEFDHLSFGDTANLIEVKTAAAFGFFRIDGWAKERVSDHGQRGQRGATDSGESFPVSEQTFQRSDPQKLFGKRRKPQK